MTPKELNKELDRIFRDFSRTSLAEYLDLTADAVGKWRYRDAIPFNKVKRIVEFLEMHNDDCITLCQNLMEYYKSIQGCREEKLLIRKQKK
jgi:hypothetical protein